MKEKPNNTYYALVWNTSLEQKESIIEGELISKDTVIPDDPRVMYGTNPNDVLKVSIEHIKTEIEYDVLTTRQSVRFIKEIEEFELPRDVRIIVWEGSNVLHIPYDKYRIVSPKDFEALVEISKNSFECKESKTERYFKWEEVATPERKLKENILNMLDLELNFN